MCVIQICIAMQNYVSEGGCTRACVYFFQWIGVEKGLKTSHIVHTSKPYSSWPGSPALIPLLLCLPPARPTLGIPGVGDLFKRCSSGPATSPWAALPVGSCVGVTVVRGACPCPIMDGGLRQQGALPVLLAVVPQHLGYHIACASHSVSAHRVKKGDQSLLCA